MSGSIVRRGLLAVGVLAVAFGVGVPAADAITLPDFPPSPSRFEAPAGDRASGFIPLPWMCGETGDVHGVLHGQVGKPLHDSTLHAVSHAAFQNLCTADAGMLIEVRFEGEYTGVVTTSIAIAGKDEAGGTAGPIGPHIIEFYMGVEIPELEPEALPAMGGEAGPISVAALAAVMLGAVLVVGSRSRRFA